MTKQKRDARYFELKNDWYDCFWEITLSGKSYTVRYGKIGAKGRVVAKSFANAELAKQAANDSMTKKHEKGYVHVLEGKPPANSPDAKMAARKRSQRKLPIGSMGERLKAIIDIGNAMKSADDFSDLLSEAAPPASKEALKALRASQPSLPPSLFRLLSTHNGIRNFEWMDVSILSCEEHIARPNRAAEWDFEEWALFQEYGASPEFDVTGFNNQRLIVFGESDDTILAFDRASESPGGELAVLYFDCKGFLGVYDDLNDFLEVRYHWFLKAQT
ncbi:MAG: WGR domain-containing protein [Deltaproteobacteria bacterium]|nr:WGR domain-containing protein [Deltaproteobacteria bacterium]